MSNTPMTISAHFAHYYQNIPIKMMLAIAIMDADEGKFGKEICKIKAMCAAIAKMELPIDFVNKHKQLPKFELLPARTQLCVQEIQASLLSVKKYFSELENRRRTLSNKDLGAIAALHREIDQTYDDFCQKRTLLKEFFERY